MQRLSLHWNCDGNHAYVRANGMGASRAILLHQVAAAPASKWIIAPFERLLEHTNFRRLANFSQRSVTAHLLGSWANERSARVLGKDNRLLGDISCCLLSDSRRCLPCWQVLAFMTGVIRASCWLTSWCIWWSYDNILYKYHQPYFCHLLSINTECGCMRYDTIVKLYASQTEGVMVISQYTWLYIM